MKESSCFYFLRMILKFLKSFLGSSYSSNSLMSLNSETSINLSRYFQSYSSPMKVCIALENIPTALMVEMSNTFAWLVSSNISWNLDTIFLNMSLCIDCSLVRPSDIYCMSLPNNSLAASLTSIFSLTHNSIILMIVKGYKSYLRLK
jgi:hypothetical protein